ncbi:MAG: hypothetical protein K2K94_04515, partial [Muribaculaceae bacterium]|nr:hypothetical protein [Muribaculaceae bacterium]
MKRLYTYLVIFLMLFATASRAAAIESDTISADDRAKHDSVRIQELALQLQEMKLNEIMLRDELEKVRHQHLTTDSL